MHKIVMCIGVIRLKHKQNHNIAYIGTINPQYAPYTAVSFNMMDYIYDGLCCNTCIRPNSTIDYLTPANIGIDKLERWNWFDTICYFTK